MNIRWFYRFVFCLVILLSIVRVAGADPPAYSRPIDIGTYPGGTSSYAYAINNAGQVVGEANTAKGENHAFLYSDGVLRDLGLIDGIASWAFGINDSGQVLVNTVIDFGVIIHHAFVWSNGTPIPLNGITDVNFYDAQGINNQGQIAGASCTTTIRRSPSDNKECSIGSY